MNTSTSSATIEKLRIAFATHGLPENVVTDNGSNFASKQNRIRHIRTALYHPASNRLAERAVQTFKEGMKKMSGGSVETRVSRVYVGATYTSSIFVRGPLLSVVIFSFIWTVDLFRSICCTFSLFSHGFGHVHSVVFSWFCPCFQCKDSPVYPHFPYRDNDLLSNSHAAVVNGRAFEFEPIRIVITSEHFIDNCLHASCSILCGIHPADETQSGRNSCPELAFLTFSLDSIMSLSR